MAKALHRQVVEGLQVHERPNGTVTSIRGADGKSTVAEVCIGARRTRINLRTRPKSVPRSIKLEGRSANWPAGGFHLDETNLAAAREVLTQLAAPAEKSAPRKRSSSSRKVSAAA